MLRCRLAVLFVCRVYSFNATSSIAGDYTAVASLTKPDSNPLNDRDDAPVSVLAPAPVVDVAVNITATPGSALVGSIFTYTINM